MKVGANNKRNLYILGGLALIGGYVLWTNVFSSPANDDTPKVAATHAVATPPAVVKNADTSLRKRDAQNRSGEWTLVYKLPGERIDPIKVDPTLRLDILAKVQRVEIEADAQRNLFQFGAAPAPIIVTPLPTVPPIKIGKGQPPPPGPTTPPPPVEATAPPITLKYYGYATPRANGNKRAFFLDNDDIIMAAEGELIKRRYKVVKIGQNSVTMEDTQFKSQQTLPIVPDAAS